VLTALAAYGYTRAFSPAPLSQAHARSSLALAPAVARMAAGYVSLPVATGPGVVAALAIGVVALAALAAALVARRIVREPVVAGLRAAA
jgi:hypothetical protein